MNRVSSLLCTANITNATEPPRGFTKSEVKLLCLRWPWLALLFAFLPEAWTSRVIYSVCPVFVLPFAAMPSVHR